MPKDTRKRGTPETVLWKRFRWVQSIFHISSCLTTACINTLSIFAKTVFRVKVLEKLYRGEETRYDVQIIHTYRNRYRVEHREFLWAPNRCDCPLLEEGHQYVLMLRRHINYERTLNRILLEEDSYAQPFRVREDSLLRPLEELCGNRGTRPQFRG